MLWFDWDAQNQHHIVQHGVSAAEVEEVLAGTPIEIPAYAKRGELRTGFVGPTASGRLLFVVVTLRGAAIRPITAYDARRGMRAKYKEYLAKEAE